MFTQTARKIPKRAKCHGAGDDHLSKKEQEICDLVKNCNPDQVPEDQTESFFGRFAKVCAIDSCEYVGIPVDKLHELFQAPEAALAQTQDSFHNWVVRSLFLQLVLNVLKSQANHFDNSNNKRSKSQSSRMIPEII